MDEEFYRTYYNVSGHIPGLAGVPFPVGSTVVVNEATNTIVSITPHPPVLSDTEPPTESPPALPENEQLLQQEQAASESIEAHSPENVTIDTNSVLNLGMMLGGK